MGWFGSQLRASECPSRFRHVKGEIVLHFGCGFLIIGVDVQNIPLQLVKPDARRQTIDLNVAPPTMSAPPQGLCKWMKTGSQDALASADCAPLQPLLASQFSRTP